MTAREAHARAMAQKSAEQLHRDADVPFAVCIAADPDGGLTVVGAWCPSAPILAAICRKVADEIDGGRAEVVDRRAARQ